MYEIIRICTGIANKVLVVYLGGLFSNVTTSSGLKEWRLCYYYHVSYYYYYYIYYLTNTKANV